MRETERKRQEKRVRDLVTRWAEPMGLLWWKLDVVYYADYDACRQLFGKPGAEAHVETVSITYATWEYLEATLEFNLQRVAQTSDEKLERVVVHELAHVLLNEMREEGGKHEERVATRVAQALLWTRGYGRKERALRKARARSRKPAKRGNAGKRPKG